MTIATTTITAVVLISNLICHGSAFQSFRLRAPTRSSTRRSFNSQLQASATVNFAKYEGLGNDFILIDDRNKLDPSLTPEQCVKLCHRNFGIGGDGVIFALKPPSSHEHDFAMRIYNSDGSEPEMCGNGIRCLAQFVNDRDVSNSDNQQQQQQQKVYRVHTKAGTIVPVINLDGTVTVDMGPPELDGPKVPCLLTPNFAQNSIVEQMITANNKEWKVSAVSMGNPHAVIFVDDVDDCSALQLQLDGPALETHPAFPAKTNVEFVQVLSDHHLKMKVWERGAGPTLACGTGTCALVVAAIRANKIPKPTSPVQVTLPGGDLWIDWKQQENGHVYMTGPGTLVFQGSAII